MPRLHRIFPRALLVLAGVLTALATGEMAHRLWLSSEGRSFDGQARLEHWRRQLDTLGSFTPSGEPSVTPRVRGKILHPFYASELEHDTGGVLAYFREGPPANHYKVLTVGGSVGSLWAASGGPTLARRLEEDPRLEGREVRVLEFAHATYKQPQQLNRVAYLFSLGYRPDVVINLDGFNEVANGLTNGKKGVHPIYPSPPSWAAVLSGRGASRPEEWATLGERQHRQQETRELLLRAERLGAFRSSLVGAWFEARLGAHCQRLVTLDESLEALMLEPEDRDRREVTGPEFDRSNEEIIRASVTTWYESSLSIHALCKARGIPYLHGLQPTLFDPGSKPMTEKERTLKGGKFWQAGVDLGYDQLRDRGRELAERGVSFLDLTRCFADVEEDLYYDPCHFVAKGARMLSEVIAPELLEVAFP